MAEAIAFTVLNSSGGGGPLAFQSTPGAKLIVGRGSKADVVLGNPFISREHFCLEWENDQLFVRDLGSTNGTRVNSMTISEPTKVQVGDTIAICDLILTACSPSEPQVQELLERSSFRVGNAEIQGDRSVQKILEARDRRPETISKNFTPLLSPGIGLSQAETLTYRKRKGRFSLFAVFFLGIALAVSAYFMFLA